jgi:AcrR family transcriptional regulator
VSRRTFYELFVNCEDCLAAAFEATMQRVEAEIANLEVSGLPWRERVRHGLVAILAFLDREPVLARVCTVQFARGGQRVVECRERIAAQLAAILDEGRKESVRGADCPPVTAEGLVGAALSIVQTRVARGEHGSLTSLTGELMGLIVLPYMGPAAARRERARPVPVPPFVQATPREVREFQWDGDPLRGIPIRLTYRTARVFEVLANDPGLSNRVVGERAGIHDQGQTSKLLARLERYGLLRNTGEGHAKGERNAWQLTPTGQQVAHIITPDAHQPQEDR